MMTTYAPATRRPPSVRLAATLALALLAGACADRPTPSGPAIAPALSEVESANLMRRFVAIGTSISMGVQSDGVKAATQHQS